MELVQPIKDKKQIESMKKILRQVYATTVYSFSESIAAYGLVTC